MGKGGRRVRGKEGKEASPRNMEIGAYQKREIKRRERSKSR
jgi:hypothetical protein